MSKITNPFTAFLHEKNDERLVRRVGAREPLEGSRIIHEKGCNTHNCQCNVVLILRDGRVFS